MHGGDEWQSFETGAVPVTRIKVCGIMDQSELLHAVRAGVDAVGFVVEIDDSRHCLAVSEAADLIKHVPVFTKSVAVIAPENVDEAKELAKRTQSDVLQVHGSLSPEDLAELKKRIPQKIVAAVAAGSKDVLSFACSADAILLDTLVNGKLGGTGTVHDWNQSADLAKRLNVPAILAGGLNPGNVAEAILKVRPYAVDVSSGTETGGKKDPEKILSFVREVRSCPL
jgi:phosphoribosylanthranilate isomerase